MNISMWQITNNVTFSFLKTRIFFQSLSIFQTDVHCGKKTTQQFNFSEHSLLIHYKESHVGELKNT